MKLQLKSFAILFTLLIVITITPVWAEEKETPLGVGGFKLGTSIDEYEFISYKNYLKQVVIDKYPGFRKGVVEYGVCERPGEIVKIKLKYQDSSRKFYKKLLKRFKKKFGKPDEFAGDSFGIVACWKWYFVDKDGNRVSLLLQHNLKNTNEVIGNMVKMQYPDRVEAERKCFNKACETHNPDAFNKIQNPPEPDKDTWQSLIPR